MAARDGPGAISAGLVESYLGWVGMKMACVDAKDGCSAL